MNDEGQHDEVTNMGILLDDASDNLLATLTKRAAELKELKAEQEKVLKKTSAELEGCMEQILRYLDLSELESLKAHGFLFFKKTSSSITTPKTEEEKKALFRFLQQKDIFYEFASVHSTSLNKLYKELAEEALQEGILEFEMPGVGKPSSYTSLQMRKSK